MQGKHAMDVDATSMAKQLIASLVSSRCCRCARVLLAPSPAQHHAVGPRGRMLVDAGSEQGNVDRRHSAHIQRVHGALEPIQAFSQSASEEGLS